MSSGFAETQASKSLEISNITSGVILSRQPTPRPFLFAYGKHRFSHDPAHLLSNLRSVASDLHLHC